MSGFRPFAPVLTCHRCGRPLRAAPRWAVEVWRGRVLRAGESAPGAARMPVGPECRRALEADGVKVSRVPKPINREP